MLSRIAENLFWIGRYVERADDTARVLDVHIHHLLEAPLSDENDICRSLLAVMGMLDESTQTPGDALREIGSRQVTELLAFDPRESELDRVFAVGG